MKPLYLLNDLMNFNETFNKGYPKNQGFIFSLQSTIPEKAQHGGQMPIPQSFTVKVVVLKGISLFQV